MATIAPATRLMIGLVAAVAPAGFASAQADPATDQAVPKEVTVGERGSDQDPLAGREPVVVADPVRPDHGANTDELTNLSAPTIKLDRRVLGIAPGEPLPRLRREGETLRKRDGRLLPPGDRGFAVFLADADPKAGDDEPIAMVIAPCMTLESMERLYEDRGEDLRFTVTGEVHTYRGVNYLLPTSQPKPWLVADGRGVQDASQPEESTSTESEGEAEATSSDTPEKVQPSEDGSTEPRSADDVLQDLLNQRDNTPPPDPSDTSKPGEGGASPPTLPPAAEDGPGTLADPLLIGLDTDQPQAELKPEGQFIVARTGRLIRSASGSQALFVLDADQRDAPEPPMIIQSCKLLETMEDTVREQGDTVPFVITGQVYVYRGANYLLPTIVRREFDRGNLE